MGRLGEKILWNLASIGLFATLLTACQGGSKSQADQTQTTSNPPQPVLGPDYAQIYCQAIGKLKLRPEAKLSQELGYFCQNASATPKLTSLIAAAQSGFQGDTPPIYVESETIADLYSDFVYLWAFTVQSKPIDLKDRPIAENLAKGLKTDTLTLNAKAATKGPEALDSSGLHLKSVALTYDLEILGSNGAKLSNTRNTELNLYQLGSTEMGFSEEHLTDVENKDYKVVNMVNFSLKDSRFDKDATATVLVSALHINFFNRQSPDTARKTTQEISQFLAKSLYQALK